MYSNIKVVVKYPLNTATKWFYVNVYNVMTASLN